MEHNRITVFLGEFGSGKTELAVNYALKLQQAGQQTAIVDIDLVKPYFRTRENRDLLENNGIKVIAPEARLANADLPVFPHNLVETFSQLNTQVVMDVGGGDSAIVLGQLRRYFDQSSYQALLVVNTMRPFTGDAEGIIKIFHRIEQVSRLKISGLVSNANLGQETTTEHVQKGLAIVEQAAKALTLPVKWVVVPDWLEQSVQFDVPLFTLKPYTHYPWMD
ncbi:MAG: hypothetical protein K0R55_1507 [Sporomusa sp.]|nr:hypothetical protein [Sporomusa sp.]